MSLDTPDATPLVLRAHGHAFALSAEAVARSTHLQHTAACADFDGTVDLPPRHSALAARLACAVLERDAPLLSERDADTHLYRVTTPSPLDAKDVDAVALSDLFLLGAYLGADCVMDAAAAHLTAVAANAPPDKLFETLGVDPTTLADDQAREQIETFARDWRLFANLRVDEDAWRDAFSQVQAAFRAPHPLP